MSVILHSNTSTLMIRIPESTDLPSYQDKPRTRKAILRTIIQTLQSKKLELIYVGLQPETANDYCSLFEGIIVSINLINDVDYDYNLSQTALLKRFKKELQYNNEHILIDNNFYDNGVFQRRIEIYLKSHFSRRNPVKEYTFSTSSGSYYQHAS